MTTRLTPGRRLRRDLDAAVAGRGMEWSETDLALTLPTIEVTRDRIEALRDKFADEVARDGSLAVRAVQLASELRQLEAQLARLVASLGLDEDDDPGPPKSPRHQAAANTRWDKRSHRQRGV